MSRQTMKLIVLLACAALVLGFAAAELQKSVRSVVTSGSLKGLPDIAYDALAERYLVVWQERGASGEDRDIRARILDREGNPIGAVIALASTGQDERFPKVAASGLSSWAAVWSTGVTIEACVVDATGKAGDFRVVTSDSSRPVDRPDIGAAPDGSALVVWEELGETGLTEIRGRSLRSTSDGPDGEEFLVAGSPDHDLGHPALASAGGGFFVTWDKAVDARRSDIEGRMVAPGAVSPESFGPIVAVAADGVKNTLPSVASFTGIDALLIVWQRIDGRREMDISYAQLTGAGVQAAGKLTDTRDLLETRPFASSVGLAGRALVTYQTAPASKPRQREIAARTIGLGDFLPSVEIALDPTRAGGGNPASVLAAGAEGRGLVVWDAKEGEGTDLYAKEWLAPELEGDGLPLALDGPIVPLADVYLSGVVTFNGAPQAGVWLSGLPAEVRTDATGAYSAPVPAPWSGTVTPVQPGFTFVPANNTYTDVAADTPGQNYQAIYVGGAEDIYEDNEDLATAAELPFGTTHDLVLNDADWFKFYVSAADAGKDFKIRVWGTGYPDTTTRRDLDFAVLDASGKLLTYAISGSPDETVFICGVSEGYYYLAHTYVGLAGTVYSVTAELSDAFGLGYIEGHVYDDHGMPIEGATVELYSVLFDWNVTHPLVVTDAAGYYKIGWVPGDFTVRFNMSDFGNDGLDWTPRVNYLGEMYNGGVVVSIAAGVTLADIDGALTAGGEITGSIVDNQGAPYTGAIAQVFASGALSVASASTNDNGDYAISRVRAGNFAIRMRHASVAGLINEWYDDHALFASADPVGVEPGMTTPGVDARLEERTWGTITGQVTDALGDPVNNLQVAILDPAGIALWTIRTDASGFYVHSRVPTGVWKVFFNASSIGTANLVSQYYPGTRFLSEAQTVQVAAGETTFDVGAVLQAAGSISGQVLNNNGSLNVIAFDTASAFSRSITLGIPVAGAPTYTIANLAPGTYKVLARPNQQGDRIPHWHPDASTFAAAGAVTVAAGATTSGVDITLAGGGGSVSGRLVDEGGTPLAGVPVIVQDASLSANYASWPSAADGTFVVRQIPPGAVKVFFNTDGAWLGSAAEYHNDKPDHGSADSVIVTDGETTALGDVTLALRPSLAVTTTTLAAGQVAVAYGQQLAATGGRPFYRWTLASGALPDGLTMSAGGLITGVPTVTGTSSFTVRVTDSTLPQGSVLQPLSITVGEYSGSGYVISGTVTAAGLPLAGVVLEGLPGDPVTSSSGTYVAIVEPAWWDTVTPVLEGYAFDPPFRSYTVVTGNQSGQDYAASPGYRLSGTVTVGGAPLSGVRLTGLPAEIRSEENGAYSIMLPAGWSGTVVPVLIGFSFSPPLIDYASLLADLPGQDYAATFAGGTDDLYEDNDSFATAAVVAMGTEITDLVLNDEDWFKFQVPAEDAGKTLGIRIWATSFPNGAAYSDPTRGKDLDFGVMDATGRLLTHSMSGSVDEVTFIPDIQPGWYYIGHTYMINPGMVYSLYVTASDVLPVGTISGRITDDVSGEGIDGVTVELWRVPFDWNESRAMAITNPDGTYEIAAFAGEVQVQVALRDFNRDPHDGLPDGWLPVRNYLSDSYDNNKTMALVAGSAVSGIDVALRPGGAISGRLTDGAGQPLAGATALAFVAPGNQFTYAYTDAEGNYLMPRLRTANYRVAFRPPDGSALGREWYADQAALGAGLAVAVAEGATTSGIDAVLTEGATVSGRVSDAEGDPIPGVTVTVHDASGIAMESAVTQADGTYSVGRLPAGIVKVLFNAATCASGNYVSEWYSDKSTSGGADAVTTVGGAATEGIDAVLAPAGAISGRLTFESDFGMLGGFVQAFKASGGAPVRGVNPDYDGNYTLRSLPPGDYRVRFSYSFSWITNYPPKWYPLGNGAFEGSVVTVAAGATVSGIDGSLVRDGGGFTGRVTDGSAGIPSVLVAAVDGNFSNVAASVAYTDADGYYTVRNVPATSIKIFFNPGARDYFGEYFSEKGDFSSADRLDIFAGNETPIGDEVLGLKPALTVTTAALPAGELGAAYFQSLGVANGIGFFHWSVTAGALPPGLTMSSNGVIDGTPTMAGTYDFTVRVTDSTFPQKSQTQALSITIGEYTGVGYTVSGTVTAGGSPLAGVTLNGLPGSPVTNAAGGYVSVVPSGWSGTATPTRSGYAFSPASVAYANVSADSAGQDYTAVPGYLISGTVTLEGAGLSGVTMAGLPGDPWTDAGGAYAVTVPAGWDGTVAPTLPGYTFAPASVPYTDVSADLTGQDFLATYAGGVDDAFEENDSLETAAVLPMGTTTGLVAHDEEWFKFYVPAGEAGKDLRVRVWGTAFPNTTDRRDIDFYVLDDTPLALSLNLSGGADETAYLCDVAEGWYTIGPMFFSIDGIVYAISIDTNEDFGLGYIEGTVRDDGGAPAAGVAVELYGEPFDWDLSHPLIYTDAAGHYRIGYTPGPYTVQFNLTNSQEDLPWIPDANYLAEVYNSGEVLTLAPGATLSGIDGQLTQGGEIRGRVLDETGAPLNMAVVYAYTGDTTRLAYDYTNASGDYKLDRLRTGNYAVRFRAPGGVPQATEWYDDGRSFAEAMPVAVVAGGIASGIDASLGPAGSISGHVENENGDPIQGVQVTAYDPAGIALQAGSTDAAGNYYIGRLPSGSFHVQFNAATATGGNYVSEYYQNVPLFSGSSPVEVTAGQTTGGIDAVLATGGTISGAVTSDGDAIMGIEVRAFAVANDLYLTTTTNEMGLYTIRNVPAGDYKIRFRPTTGALAVEWNGDKADYATANALAVDVGQDVIGVDADLSGVSATITGRVTDGFGAGIAGIEVIARDTERLFAYSTGMTNEDGDYSITRLPSCQTKVLFSADRSYLNYANEYYNDKAEQSAADAVQVTVGETTSGIDSALALRPALTVTTETVPAGELGVAYVATVAGSGGRTLYRFDIVAGALPNGLAMNGRGEITGLPTLAGSYGFTVRLTDSTWSQQIATKELSIAIGQYTGIGHTISGAVIIGGLPLAGVTIGGLPGEPVTNAEGGYVAVVPDGWTGTATPALEGHIFDPVARPYSNVIASLDGQDFTASLGYMISGIVTLESAPLEAVQMNGLPGDPLTDTMGYYAVGVPAGWSGTVTPALQGYTFVPTNRTYSNVLSVQANQDYAAAAIIPATAKVDFNGDGQEDILWRNYGAGDYQGLNVVWLMNQSAGASPVRLSSAPMVPGKTSLLTNQTQTGCLAGSIISGASRPRASKPSVKSFMSARKTSKSAKAGMRVGSPLDAGPRSSAKGRKALPPRQFSNGPSRKDAVAPEALSSGSAQIASIGIGQEIVFSQIPDTGWEIAGTGDFNGDTKTDILWRYYGTGGYQGLNVIWFMDGTTFVSESVFSQIPDTNWRIAGTGDFNGDAKTDILWRYYGTGAYQGLNVIWLMNGSQFAGEAVFSQVLDTDWRIEGTGDFNSDGQTDILWRYYGTGPYQGLNDIWFMNGSTFIGESVFSQILDTSWQIGGTGDFNGDGQTDILWRYYGTGAYQGLNDIWYMNGTTFVSEEVFSQIPDINWRIANR